MRCHQGITGDTRPQVRVEQVTAGGYYVLLQHQQLGMYVREWVTQLWLLLLALQVTNTLIAILTCHQGTALSSNVRSALASLHWQQGQRAVAATCFLCKHPFPPCHQGAFRKTHVRSALAPLHLQ